MKLDTRIPPYVKTHEVYLDAEGVPQVNITLVKADADGYPQITVEGPYSLNDVGDPEDWDALITSLLA